MDTNTPKNIPYEFGDSTHTKTGPTYQEYAKNRRFSCVFFTKSGAPLLIQCGLIVKTLNRDISKTRRNFYDLIKVLDVSRNACSTEHRMRKSYF